MPRYIVPMPKAWTFLAAAGLAGVVLSACGDTSVSTAASGQQVRDRAEEVYTRFAGTVEQRNAGYTLKAYALNGGTAACEGHPEWDWPLAREIAGPVDPLRSDWFAELQRPSVSINEMVNRDWAAKEAILNADDPNTDYTRALDSCLGSEPAISDEDLDSAAVPDQGLLEDWDSMVWDAESDLIGDAKPYYDCMNDSDLELLRISGERYDDSAPTLTSLAGAAGPAPSLDADPLTYSEGWNEFLAIEQEVLDADEACRGEQYNEHIGELLPLIEEFEKDHEDEIAEAESGWSQREAEIAELGFNG